MFVFCSYEKFLREIDIIKDTRLRQMAIERTVKDTEEFKRLRLRADARNPPIDTEGTYGQGVSQPCVQGVFCTPNCQK
jgi:hypothetical protein